MADVGRRDAVPRRESGPWAGRLFMAPGIIVYVGPGAAATPHGHHAVQLIWAQREVELRLPRGRFQVRSALVPAGVEHAFEAHGQPITLLLVERHGARGLALDRYARETPGVDLSHQLSGSAFPAEALSRLDVVRWCGDVFASLGVTTAGFDTEPSPSVRRAIAYVDGTVRRTTPRLADAAAYAFVSETTLTHRFSREVGVPFRRFVVWSRLKLAVDEVRRGANLTEAAVGAGFSDAAHLSRAFRATFGLSPSQVLPRVEFVGSLWAGD